MKILVVDDHPLVREGLSRALQQMDQDLRVVMADTGAHSLDMVQQHRDIGLVLLGDFLPDMRGLCGLAAYGEHHPDLPVVVLSGSSDARTLCKLLDAGAAGLVPNARVNQELPGAIQQVRRGYVYVPHALSRERAAPRLSHRSKLATRLTKRQELVLDCLFDGHSNKAIAAMLYLSEETVKSHVAAILRHFDVQNRTQAVVAAVRSGYQSYNERAQAQRAASSMAP